MTELVKGQNLVWPSPTLTLEVHGVTCDVSALLVGEDLQVGGADDFVFYNQPTAPGVQWAAGSPQRLVVTLPALTRPRLLALISVDPHAPTLGQGPAPQVRLTGAEGQVVTFHPTGLRSERALICVEAYQRAGQWKVRAVGQGYDGGLAAAIIAHGVEVEDEPSPVVPPQAAAPPPAWAAPTGPPGAAPTGYPAAATQSGPFPQPGPPGPAPSGPSELERLLHQLGCIFDDASRSAAGLQSTLDFARERLTHVHEEMVSDPRTRNSAAAHGMREQAQAQHDSMTGNALERHRTDVAQLVTELARWESQVPAPLADWSAPGWRASRPASGPVPAVRLGLSYTEQAPGLQVPFLVSLPLTRPIWFATGPGGEPQALAVVRALLLRMLAAFGPGGLRLVVADMAHLNPYPFPPLGAPGCQVQDRPGATSLAELTAVLSDLAQQADLGRMAYEAGMDDALTDRPAVLLVITDFPTGFDEPTLAVLHDLLQTAPYGRIQVVLTGTELDRPPAAAARVLDLCRHYVSGEGGGFVDGPTGVAWTFVPDTGPASAEQTHAELSRASRGE